MAELRLEHIYKYYDQKEAAVDDFNLHIKDKEFIVFVGRRGAASRQHCGWLPGWRTLRRVISISVTRE